MCPSDAEVIFWVIAGLLAGAIIAATLVVAIQDESVRKHSSVDIEYV